MKKNILAALILGLSTTAVSAAQLDAQQLKQSDIKSLSYLVQQDAKLGINGGTSIGTHAPFHKPGAVVFYMSLDNFGSQLQEGQAVLGIKPTNGSYNPMSNQISLTATGHEQTDKTATLILDIQNPGSFTRLESTSTTEAYMKYDQVLENGKASDTVRLTVANPQRVISGTYVIDAVAYTYGL